MKKTSDSQVVGAKEVFLEINFRLRKADVSIKYYPLLRNYFRYFLGTDKTRFKMHFALIHTLGWLFRKKRPEKVFPSGNFPSVTPTL